MKAGLFKKIVDESEFDCWQILMSELDSTLNRMKYISVSELKDGVEIQQFNSFWDEIKNTEAVVVSVTDNADLYEFGDNNVLVILYEVLNEKMIIFDIQDQKKIIGKMESYK